MKAIISLRKPNGQYADCGGSYRHVVEAVTEAGIMNVADGFARGKAYRAEIYFDPNKVYGTPDKVLEKR